jgi:hypothetical protein
MNDPSSDSTISCGCGGDATPRAPQPIDNPPGRNAIARRVGTHGTFLAALLDDLSAPPPQDPNQTAPDPLAGTNPLEDLATRLPTDPTIAMLDAWSTVADVITFYQERFANEAYLRTATERKSIVELAKLVGYQPRPGVAASAFLAFELADAATLGLPPAGGQPTADTKALIPAGTQAQSLPGPGEQPQIFETSADLNARAEWNTLPVRQSRQQLLTLNVTDNTGLAVSIINQNTSAIYLAGTATNLNPGSPLLLALEDASGNELDACLTRAKTVEPDTVANRTRVTLEPLIPALGNPVGSNPVPSLTLNSSGAPVTPPLNLGSTTQGTAGTTVVSLTITSNLTSNTAIVLHAAPGTEIALPPDPPAYVHSLVLNTDTSGNVPSPIRVRISKGAKANVNGLLRIFAPAARVDASVPVVGVVNAVPTTVTLTLPAASSPPSASSSSPTSTPFLLPATTQGFTGPPVVVVISGPTIASGSVTLKAPAGAEISLKKTSGFATSVGVKTDATGNLSPPTVYMRVSSSATASVSGNLTLTVTGTDSHGLKVQAGFSFLASGTVNPGSLVKQLLLPRPTLSLLKPTSDTDPSGVLPQPDSGDRLLTAVRPEFRTAYYTALANLKPDNRQATRLRVFAPRQTAVMFGANAPQQPIIPTTTTTPATPAAAAPAPPPTTRTASAPAAPGPSAATVPVTFQEWKLAATDAVNPNVTNLVYLDHSYDKLHPGDYVVVERHGAPATTLQSFKVTVGGIGTVTRADYAITAQSTTLTLDGSWHTDPFTAGTTDLSVLRQINLYIQPDELTLAEEPLPASETVPDDTKELFGSEGADATHTRPSRIALDGYYPELEAGRLLIVSGERADIPGTSGTQDTELVVLSSVQHRLAGDDEPERDGVDRGRTVGRPYTVLFLDAKLSFTYVRSSVVVRANVVMATQGETRSEVLGSGDPAQPWQTFTLHNNPVTYVPAANAAGVDSTLRVRVDGVLWNEVPRFTGAGPTDHVYTTARDETETTTVQFGDGRTGARPSKGVENIAAVLRVGLGEAGNVQAGQISILLKPPSGVKSVTNPSPATGGADPESLARARRNVPLGSITLGRIVSVNDYASFARTFAGIAKADARPLTDGRTRFIHLTVAGLNDIPIAETSDLLVSLRRALANLGDPYRAVVLAVRERIIPIVYAQITLDPAYLWTNVEPQLRQALVNAFPFENRGLGRDLYLSEVIATLQGIDGVTDVEMLNFGGVDELTIVSDESLDRKATTDALNLIVPAGSAQQPSQSLPQSISVQFARLDSDGTVHAAQIAYFGPETLDVTKSTVSFQVKTS